MTYQNMIILCMFTLMLTVLPVVTFAYGHDGPGVGRDAADNSGYGGGGYGSGSSGTGTPGGDATNGVRGTGVNATITTTSYGTAAGIATSINNSGVNLGGYQAVVGTNFGTGQGIVSFERPSFGGDATNGSSNPVTKITITTSCKTQANLDGVVISFARELTPTTREVVSSLDIETSYIPNVIIFNSSCRKTDYGVVGTNYKNQPPIGEEGGFPVRLQLDFDKDGTIDYDKTINNIGPLKANGTFSVDFPTFLTGSDKGDHKATATIDAVGSVNGGCSGDWGCINEPDETNIIVQPFSVTKPTLSLGSVLLPTDSFSVLLQAPLNRGVQREISSGENIGLVWSGKKIDFSSCNGSGPGFDGSTDGYSVQDDINNNFTSNVISQKTYDVNIDEPTSYTFKAYTLTCLTTFGKTMSDTHILNNGGDTSARTSVIPLPENIEIELGKKLGKYPYKIKNNGVTDIVNYEHTLQIAGNDLLSYTENFRLNSGDSRLYRQRVDWTPTVLGKYTAKVCVDNVNGNSRERCRNGTISVIKVGVVSDVTAPTITATPSLVRVGDTVEVTWNPGTYSPCVLSPQRLAGDASGIIADSNSLSILPDYEITGATTLKIDCGGGIEAVAEIKVLPAIYEI